MAKRKGTSWPHPDINPEQAERMVTDELLKLKPSIEKSWKAYTENLSASPKEKNHSRTLDVSGFINETTCQRFHDLNRALRKINRETWGICEECEKPIPKGRLQVFPEANHCTACKGAIEIFTPRRQGVAVHGHLPI